MSKYRIEVLREIAPDLCVLEVEAPDEETAVNMVWEIVANGDMEWSEGDEVSNVWINDVEEEDED